MHPQQPSAIGGFRGSRRGRNVQPELHVHWYFWTNCVSNYQCDVHRPERRHGRSLGKPNHIHLHHTAKVEQAWIPRLPSPFLSLFVNNPFWDCVTLQVLKSELARVMKISKKPPCDPQPSKLK